MTSPPIFGGSKTLPAFVWLAGNQIKPPTEMIQTRLIVTQNPKLIKMESIYERRRKHSLYWFNKSSDLRAAAAAVWFSMDGELAGIVVSRANLGDGFNMGVAVPPVYEMLCGMSLELVFKAIAVESGQPVNETTHDLLEHVKVTELAYTKNQKALLKIYSHAVTWEGRYPAPKREAAMVEHTNLVHANLFDRTPVSKGSKLSVMRPNGALGWEGFSELWGKACARYFETREANGA